MSPFPWREPGAIEAKRITVGTRMTAIISLHLQRSVACMTTKCQGKTLNLYRYVLGEHDLMNMKLSQCPVRDDYLDREQKIKGTPPIFPPVFLDVFYLLVWTEKYAKFYLDKSPR